MKKWLALMIVLAFSVAACDFGGDDTDEEITPFETTDDFEVDPDPDATVTEVEEGELPPQQCETGESAGYTKVRILDDPENATLVDCNTNPGADIDSICVFGPDGTEKGCAATVLVEEIAPVCDENHKDDPNEVIGIPNGTAQDGKFEGYYSLNGGAIVVTFDGGAEMLCGDIVHVVEMYNPDLAGSTENYSVFYGTDADLWGDPAYIIQSDETTGEADIDVLWFW